MAPNGKLKYNAICEGNYAYQVLFESAILVDTTKPIMYTRYDIFLLKKLIKPFAYRVVVYLPKYGSRPLKF